MRAVIYPKAGKIALVQFNADGTLSLTDASKFIGANGTVQKIETTIDVKSSELLDGNSDWPMGVYDTGRDGTIKVTMSSYQPAIYAALMGQTVTKETAEKMWAAEEEHTIPAASAFTVELENAVAAGGTIVVLDNSGSPFVSSGSGPAAGSSALLVECLSRAYAAATGLRFHENTVTPAMTHYHAFYEVDSRTPIAIVELGFMGGDRALLTAQQERVAQGVAEGIIAFFNATSDPPTTPTARR